MVIDTRRIVWVIIGALFAGLPGAIIAWFLSGIFLSRVPRSSFGGFGQQQSNVQAVFFQATFQVMGHVAKADGRVSEREIDHARQLMTQMGLGDAEKRQAIQFFTEGKAAGFQLNEALGRLQAVCGWQFVLKRLFVQIQMQAAAADGAISQEQQAILQNIAQTLGVDQVGFGGAYHGQQSYHQRSYQQHSRQAYQSSGVSLRQAYDVLGVKEGVSQAELKKAYRKMMSQYHPDKLQSQGLPDSMMKMATEKTQEIKAAYEQIKKAKAWT